MYQSALTAHPEGIGRAVALLIFVLVGSSALGDSKRLHIDDVQILRPSESGFEASGPVDVLIEQGRVVHVGRDDSIELAPGEMRLRGGGRWLVATPRARVEGQLGSHDVVLAGLSGLGGLHATGDTSGLEARWARAGLDSTALPERLGSEVPVEGTIAAGGRHGPTLPRLAEAVGGSDALVASMSRRANDPFRPGIAASFLLLSKDPRTHPDALLDPHAVVLGSEVVLRAERQTRMEEADAGSTLAAPTPNLADATWVGRYQLVIDGLRRGRAVLALEDTADGMVVARVHAHVAYPVDEKLEATVSWLPAAEGHDHRLQGDARVTLHSQGRALKAWTRMTPEGRVLEITLNGVAPDTGPIPLKPDQLLLPHTLLILIDCALMAGSSPPGEILEVAFMDGPLEVHRSPRAAVQPLSKTDQLPMDERFMREMEGGATASFGSLLAEEGSGDPAFLILDRGSRPLFLLLETPWGFLEWSLESDLLSGDGTVFKPEKVDELAHPLP